MIPMNKCKWGGSPVTWPDQVITKVDKEAAIEWIDIFMSFHPEKDLRSAKISGLDATIKNTRTTKLEEMCNKLPA